MWLLALVVTALHFLVTCGYTALSRRLPGAGDTAVQIEFAYDDGIGALRDILSQVTGAQWTVQRLHLAEPAANVDDSLVRMTLDVSGSAEPNEPAQLVAGTRGVRWVHLIGREDIE